jgi:HEAT repeat protein
MTNLFVPMIMNGLLLLVLQGAIPASSSESLPANVENHLIAGLEEKETINKRHILYLVQHQDLLHALDMYEKYRQLHGKHDFEVLQQMCCIILEEGARSNDPERQLLSIYGSSIGGCASSIDILENAITSSSPETQIASIQFLGQLQDDRSDELLNKAMSSEYLFTRMEAAYQLALRKSRTSVGQIEALMYRIPHQFWSFFPEYFALIGTSDAIAVLRQLIDDSYHNVRIEAILSAARYGRDDLLPLIRANATHLNMAEQEACAAALGALKDSKSIPQLKKLARSPSSNVQIAACRSLYVLGDPDVKNQLMQLAQTQDLFAISLLGDIPETESLLFELSQKENLQVRINAAIALLKRRDPRCLPAICEILIRDTRDLGVQPQLSMGKSLMSWKVIPSAVQHLKHEMYDLVAITLNIREQLLSQCLELPEKDFLALASRLFDAKQIDLMPLLVSLVQNLQTPEAIALLQQKAQTTGAPLIRAYCSLALFRLQQAGPYEQILLDWIDKKRSADIIRFRPMLPKKLFLVESPFELTPEESSRLLIETYAAIANRHEKRSIDIILGALKSGNDKNRYVLAGLLMLALQ